MKTMNFFETIAACDLNIGRCKQLDELIKVYEYSRSMSFLDFGPKLKLVFLRNHLTILTKFCIL